MRFQGFWRHSYPSPEGNTHGDPGTLVWGPSTGPCVPGLRDRGIPERDSGQVPEPLPSVQGEVMYGFMAPSNTPLYTYDNPSSEVVKHTMRLAAERDGRFNSEETRIYNDTKVELEFGSGFLLRAHP